MESRPSWIPEWAWEEYQEFVGTCGHLSANWVVDLSRTSERPAEGVARNLVFDEELSPLWTAMHSRDEAHKTAWKKDEWLTPERISRKGRKKTWSLFMHVLGTMNGPPSADLVSGDERRARGARIASLAHRLKGELSRRSYEGFPLPPKIEEHVRAEARKLAKTLAENASKLRSTSLSSVPYPTEFAEDCFLRGAMAAFCHGASEAQPLDFPLLKSLEAGSLAWAESSPIVFRPRDRNACRVYFVIEMTAYFRRWYETPLREITASLTRKIFDCEIDASAVAKLAP